MSSFPARVPIFGSIFLWALTSAVLSKVRVALFVDIRQFFVRIYREINIIYMLILMLIQSKPYIADTLYSDFFRKNGRLKLKTRDPIQWTFIIRRRWKLKLFHVFIVILPLVWDITLSNHRVLSSWSQKRWNFKNWTTDVLDEPCLRILICSSFLKVTQYIQGIQGFNCMLAWYFERRSKMKRLNSEKRVGQYFKNSL